MRASINKLPVSVKRKLKSAVESELERYRLWKFVMFQEREATITASWSAAPKGFTGSVSDQTGNIAAYNVDEPEHRRNFCEKVERCVSRLPEKERIIITERYMQRTEVYDFVVFNQILDPPMSHVPYDKLKVRAMTKLALMLNIQIEGLQDIF